MAESWTAVIKRNGGGEGAIKELPILDGTFAAIELGGIISKARPLKIGDTAL